MLCDDVARTPDRIHGPDGLPASAACVMIRARPALRRRGFERWATDHQAAARPAPASQCPRRPKPRQSLLAHKRQRTARSPASSVVRARSCSSRTVYVFQRRVAGARGRCKSSASGTSKSKISGPANSQVRGLRSAARTFSSGSGAAWESSPGLPKETTAANRTAVFRSPVHVATPVPDHRPGRKDARPVESERLDSGKAGSGCANGWAWTSPNRNVAATEMLIWVGDCSFDL